MATAVENAKNYAIDFINEVRGVEIDGVVTGHELAHMKAQFVDDIKDLGGNWGNSFYTEAARVYFEKVQPHANAEGKPDGVSQKFWGMLMNAVEADHYHDKVDYVD